LITNVLGSGICVLIAIAVFIFLCFRNVHTGIAALIAAFIAAFGSTNSLATSMFTTFTTGVGSLVTLMFMVFTISGLFAYLMDITGCAMSVGKTMVKWIGVDRAYLAITATTVILLFAGIGTYLFVIVVLAAPLMKAANLPRKVGMIAAFGVSPAISFCLPIANVPASLPNKILGTGTFDAPLLSIATAAVGLVLFFLWMNHMVKDARKKGEGYDGNDDVGDVDTDTSHLPSFATSISPILVVVISAVLLNLVKINGVGMADIGVDSTAQVAIAQLLGVISVLILHFARCKEHGIIKSISQGAPSMWGFLVLAGCVYGFGQVVASCAAFAPVQDWVMHLSLNPYVTAMISVAIMAALTTDSVAAMMIWLPMFGQSYLSMGVNGGALRRLVLCTTQSLDALPHAQSIAITLGLFGLTHKQAYKDMFITALVFPTIFSIFCCICCVLFY
jgi:H+/gluconate symporter-like permease